MVVGALLTKLRGLKGTKMHVPNLSWVTQSLIKYKNAQVVLEQHNIQMPWVTNSHIIAVNS